MASKGLEALAPHGLKSQGYTVSNYPRDNLTPATRGILDALAANPTTANIGVRSGYRDPTKNAKVGGAKKSQHMLGNAIDLDISGLSAAQKKEALDTAIAAGAKGIGVYASGNSLHVDPRKNPTVWGQLANAYKGMSKKQFGLLPDWARSSIDAMFGGFNPQPNAALPETMKAPQTLAQVQAQEAVAQAYRDPLRALDVVPNRPALSMPARPVTPTPPSRLAPAPVGQVTRAPLGPITPAAQNTVRPSLAPSSLPSTRPTTTVATRPATPAPTGLPAARQTTVATRPATPAPTGLPAAPGPTTAQLAQQYGQYRTPTTYTNVRKALQAVPAVPIAPAPAIAPPAQVVAPAPVLAPALAAPKVVKDYAVAEAVAPPAPPRATAYDVYNGLADSALDNTGQNTVGRLPDGTTTVTNKYGVTTGMTPAGKQTAVGSFPGALPGISPPSTSKIGGAIKGAIPGVAGSTVGGLLGGPIGALLGGLLAREVTKPGGLLSNQVSYQTSAFGNINAARPQRGLGFPDAPSGGYGTGGKMGASFSNNSAEGMRGISPGAADAIGRGQGGLY